MSKNTINMKMMMMVLVLLMLLWFGRCEYESGIGDPGMKRDGLRVAIEAWNQCNEVHEEAPNMGSPRQADCFDLIPLLTSSSSNHSQQQQCMYQSFFIITYSIYI